MLTFCFLVMGFNIWAGRIIAVWRLFVAFHRNPCHISPDQHTQYRV
ncbi:hypothetical protein DLH96_21240 [Vibrio parahaemolyticus]|nr:hypothetical protein [Vibrio parahaemolyticus]EGQ8884527.1 hypothetical protein [Vibrio parahaemolyticus]EGQ8917221.1 hypothetical protein [Vibrio parahaemolyticus]EGQ8936968.1 hypothetical protein [Vibrio parahaemolyticus]EGR3279377.1 hypothetical protein [Vibrio parahaemolyticus]